MTPQNIVLWYKQHQPLHKWCITKRSKKIRYCRMYNHHKFIFTRRSKVRFSHQENPPHNFFQCSIHHQEKLAPYFFQNCFFNRNNLVSVSPCCRYTLHRTIMKKSKASVSNTSAPTRLTTAAQISMYGWRFGSETAACGFWNYIGTLHWQDE